VNRLKEQFQKRGLPPTDHTDPVVAWTGCGPHRLLLVLMYVKKILFNMIQY